MEREILYSLAPDEFRREASRPTLTRHDAVCGPELKRYVVIDDKAVKVWRSSCLDYYLRFSINKMKNEVVYIDPTTTQIYEEEYEEEYE
jgi:hypothetical protein